jgi:micrococcal nuclease
VHPVRAVALLSAVALCAAGACGSRPTTSSTSTAPSGGDGVPVRVTRVVDGDTIHVLMDGRDERVRFIGIDSPEIAHGGRPAECFGDRAFDQTRRRLEGRSVRLDFDVDRRDRFGRLLAYVSDAQGLVNLALVRDGYAIVLTVPPDTRLADEFERAEVDARAAGRGLWSACPTPGS